MSSIYNVSTGKSTTVNDLYKVFNELRNGKLHLEYKSERPGDILHSALDSTKIQKYLGWLPKTNLVDGIRQTYEWFKGKSK
jgi:UDP-glucose 4-epimerase